MTSTPNTRPAVVVIATSWGRRHGGINSFSTDLCMALAAIAVHHRVVCVALSADDADRADAASADVVLLTLHLDVNSAADHRWTSQVLGVLAAADISTIDHWVGHDAITGELAVSCARDSKQGKATVLMHMSYDDYLYVKHPASEGTTIADRSTKQKEVLRSSHFACAVGPLLFDRLCEIRGNDNSVAQLVPGLPKDVSAHAPIARPHAIAFGRFTAADALVKQAPLVAAGFARAFRWGFEYQHQTWRDAQLTLIGVPPDEAEQLSRLAEKEAGRLVNMGIVEFREGRERLLGLLSEANACLMLSWHEGFGLAAWEAIGAGVPVILSRKSGVFRLLESLGGAATGCVTSIDVRGRSDGAPQEEDIESVKNALLEVTRNIPASLSNAQSLGNLLRVHDFTWEGTAKTLATLIGLPTTKSIVEIRKEAGLADPTDVVQREAEAARRRDMFARRIGYQPDPFFKGRQAELQLLVQGLKEKKSLQIRSVIWGMGGVGKTALAVQLCHQLIAHDVFADGILWYRVRQESVAEVIKRCTIDLDLDPDVNAMTDMEARIAEFQHRLRKLDLLIVLDNADYGPEVMRPIFDLFRGIPLLITSRREFDLPGSIRVPLGDLKPEEAVALVRDLLDMDDEATRSGSLLSLADIEELCGAVGCLPIALVLASAHIRERRLPIRSYISAWHRRRDRLRLLTADRIDVKEEKLRDVRTCFGISYDDLDARAKRILAYMGLWEGRDFSLAHLSSVIDETVYPHADGHDGALTVACELPGGTLGVTSGEDGRVLVWDLSDRRRPRAVLTVFEGTEPIADLVVGPEGRQFLIQTDAGSIAMLPSVDVMARLVARAAVLKTRAETPFKERLDLVVAEDGVPVIEVREGRLLFRLRLAWPSLTSPGELPKVEALCEVVSDTVGDGSRPPDDPDWRRSISHAWRPRPRAGPGVEGQDLVASMVLSHLRVEVPELPEPRTPREASLLARAAERESVPAWALVAKIEEVSEGLAAASVLLQQRSLVDNVRADDTERVRVHPLVSEFAAEHLSTEERDRAVPALSRFYLERMKSSRKHFDTDEANIEFSLIWALQNWTPAQLTGGAILAEVADALEYRGRYALALQWSEAYVRATTKHGTDLQAGRAWTHHALALNLCSREQESLTALFRGRELLERASRERPILAEEVSALWWSWSFQSPKDNIDRAGLRPYTDVMAAAARRLRLARGVPGEEGSWSFIVQNRWPDNRSRKVLDSVAPILADTLWNRKIFVARLARLHGDVADLMSAHNQLLALGVDDVSENVLYVAHGLRLDASLAARDTPAASTCLDTLRHLAQRMPSEATRSELLFAEAQVAVLGGRPREARAASERARDFLQRPDNSPPDEWFQQVYFQLADGQLEPSSKMLREVRGFWPSLDVSERDNYHRLAAWLLTAVVDHRQARLAWARAEAYDRKFATAPPWKRKTWVELYAAGSALGVVESEVSEADEALWGPVAKRPYVLVRGPNVELEELTPDAKPDAKPKVIGTIEPLHLRNSPATVDELRAYCASSGTPLPWYYSVHHPDAADSDWAIFVPYAVALRLAEHIDEGLPGTIGWGALPENPAWRLSVPAQSTPLPHAASIDEWIEQSPSWLVLMESLLRPSEIAPGNLPLVRALLCADPVSAIDKWRIVDIVRSAGREALPPRLGALVGIAAARGAPSPLLTAGVLARLERDWRSIACLAGIVESKPDAVWLRPETRKPHETFGTIEHMGAIGALTREGTPGPCLLVPDACAWADVLVWPSRLFDPTWYREEAPPWP